MVIDSSVRITVVQEISGGIDRIKQFRLTFDQFFFTVKNKISLILHNHKNEQEQQ